MSDPSSTTPERLLSRLSSHERERLGEALRRLLAYGSILGAEAGQGELYHWGYQNRDWLEEIAALLDLKLFWEHELRLVQAVPQRGDFLLRLKLDATLVLLALWYEFDTAIRDRGETPPVTLTAEQLNDSLRSKFEPLKRHLPSPTRLREILVQAQRKNLLRFTPDADFPNSGIEILSTLKRVIPFQDLEEWSRHVERQLAGSENATAAGMAPSESDIEEEASNQ